MYDKPEVVALEIPAVEAKASEDKLGLLHGVVAEYLTLKLMTGAATAAEVGAAITFLKNNSITASPSTNAAISNLTRTLAERKARKGGKLTAAEGKEAEEAFQSLMGRDMPGLQ